MQHPAAKGPIGQRTASAPGRIDSRGTARHFPAVKALVACGVVSSVLYVVMDAIAALRYDGYSYRSQAISELSAVGAPTRPMLVAFGFVYELLVFAFGLGVLASARGRRSVSIVGGLLVTFAVVGLAWPFAPMHRREVLAADGGTWTDTMHLVLSGFTVVSSLLIIGFGAGIFGKRFRLYSIATMAVLLVFGGLTGLASPRVAENGSTPWLGLTERISTFGFMLWFAALAIALLRGHTRNKGRGAGGTSGVRPT